VSDVTELLLKWNSGDETARAGLMEELYAELRTIAARHLSNERSSAELQPSALVNEAYLRLIDLNRIQWQNRAHFLAMSAKVMRDILVDEARKRRAAKRDGGIQVTLSGISSTNDDPTTNALMLHDLLEQLAEIDADRARLVELRFFGGLTIEETAEVMGISPATVKRSWEVARGWLYREANKGLTR
jgi:RNA polymerase sigma factor (TIGR02999 family)